MSALRWFEKRVGFLPVTWANLTTFLWGVAEATLFFIVPDVAIGLIALTGLRQGVVATLYAIGGALVGGAVMYFWGQADLEGVNALLMQIPAISAADITKAAGDLQTMGSLAVFLGPLATIPYKVYAAHAHLVTGIIPFLLLSIPARGIRFLLVATGTAFLSDRLADRISMRRRVQIVLLGWALFYTFFFLWKSQAAT